MECNEWRETDRLLQTSHQYVVTTSCLLEVGALSNYKIIYWRKYNYIYETRAPLS